jgi:CheY-like chemotaxis protein
MRGTGTILIVDDEPIVRVTAKTVLEHYGYKVLLACDGQQGVEVFREHAGTIVAVLLDMTMPAMGGEETFRHLRRIRPDVRVIVSSGYNEVEAVRRFTSKSIAAFIQKPYSGSKLALVVKRAIGARETGAGSG